MIGKRRSANKIYKRAEGEAQQEADHKRFFLTMDWFLKARQYVDDFTDSIVEQANVAQVQMAEEQTKVLEEVAKQKQNFEGESQLPWETSDDSLAILSQDVMEQIFSLSLTEQNFSVAPPQLEVMTFVFTEHIPTAMRLLALDANLARMHAKVIKLLVNSMSFVLQPIFDFVISSHSYHQKWMRKYSGVITFSA